MARINPVNLKRYGKHLYNSTGRREGEEWEEEKEEEHLGKLRQAD